jgi:hypothetical protein
MAKLARPAFHPGRRVCAVEMLVKKIEKIVETAVAVDQMLFNPLPLLIMNRSSHVSSEINVAETMALELMLHGCALSFVEF